RAVAEGRRQLDQVLVDGAHRGVGGEVVDPEDADRNDEGGGGFADAEPDDGEGYPGERRDRPQEAGEPSLRRVDGGEERDRDPRRHAERRADHEADGIMDQAGLHHRRPDAELDLGDERRRHGARRRQDRAEKEPAARRRFPDAEYRDETGGADQVPPRQRRFTIWS